MKKILLSLAAIVFVGAAAAGATGAFFSDNETSTGNTFTAGAIDLKVDSQAHYDGLVCSEVTAGVFQWKLENADVASARPDLVGQPCGGTWNATDLGPTNQFFNLSDIKPGDRGENTISLHVVNNDAYACADVNITSNSENGTSTPEVNAGDSATLNGPFDGELAQNLNFFAWSDNGVGPNHTGAGDNIWEVGELPLFSNVVGAASDVLGGKSYTLADPSVGPLPAGSTNYVGLAWCAGTMTAVNGVITCDGAGMGNQAQTDGMTADVTFRVEQARNNPNFKCTPPVTKPTT